MKATVDQAACVGCGLCAETCPNVFEIVDGLAVAKAGEVSVQDAAICRKAAEDCPVECIQVAE